jgi:hypothetical protein
VSTKERGAAQKSKVDNLTAATLESASEDFCTGNKFAKSYKNFDSGLTTGRCTRCAKCRRALKFLALRNLDKLEQLGARSFFKS